MVQQLAYKIDHFAYNIYILYLYVFVPYPYSAPYFLIKHRKNARYLLARTYVLSGRIAQLHTNKFH